MPKLKFQRRRQTVKPRSGVHVEAPTPTLYRWLIAQAIPYVAVMATDGSLTILDESRWSCLLGAAEAHEVTTTTTTN